MDLKRFKIIFSKYKHDLLVKLLKKMRRALYIGILYTVRVHIRQCDESL